MARKSSSKIPHSGARPSRNEPRSGTRTADASKFDLIAELGRGGMATVYLARAKKRPDKLLVLKQLRSDLAENPEFLAMFLEEARLAGKLSHPNIVETYEVGQDAGIYYIAMEYLEGLSLQAVLTKFGWKAELTFPLQVWILIEALKALEHAYTQRDDDGTLLKIVHRDVSPPNIILTFDGGVKLVDFGIAKAANSHVETRTGLIKGKLTYMAPEQAASGDVDSRTDIYSVGVMLWQAAAGTRRWKGIENTDVLKRLHAGEVADPPKAEKNGLPAIVDDIVLKAIAADPEQRYKSATAFASVLESLLRELKSEPGKKELAALMSKHFGDARQRASEVMKERIEQLDAARGEPRRDSTKESVTAIRTSAVKTTQKGKAGADATEGSKPSASEKQNAQVGGAASILAEKVARPPKKIEPPSNEVEITKTAASPTGRRASNIVRIGIVGTIAAGALAYLAIRSHHVSTTELSPAAPQASATMSSAPVPQDNSVAPESSVLAPLPEPTTALVPSGKTLPGRPSSLRPKRSAGSPAPAPKPVAAAQPVVSPPVVVVTPPAPPSPPTPIPAATSDQPAVDRQDPWGKSSGSPSGTGTPVHNDPWR